MLSHFNKKERAKRYHKFSILIFQYSIWFWLCQVRKLRYNIWQNMGVSIFVVASCFAMTVIRKEKIYGKNPCTENI